jgi:metallo-beta-lactamase family protein
MKSYTNKRSEPTVTFWGAARTVTGSMHLVEIGPYRLLLDCGLVRGPRDESRQHNRDFPFDPATLDAVVLSHAHVDHCGNLPNLVRQGFQGPIYCTPATRELVAVMLADSARIQEEDANVVSVVRAHPHGGSAGGGRGPRPDERGPLYTRQDARTTVSQCVTLDYGQVGAINPDVQVRLGDAGHILGSAIVSLRASQGGREYRLTFTGDLGRRGLPFLREPSPVPAADLIVSESTYGGRTHETVEGMAARMGDVVRRTVARGGKVLIPAFSLGRTQLVIHYLRRWMADGVLPTLPIYVDSPLAAQIAKVYERYPGALVPEQPGGPPAEYLASLEEAHERSVQRDPCVIVASGGMCEGGRIVHHLRLHVDDPRSSLVLVSYQAPHLVGARLLEKRPTVRFHGRNWNKWIEVAELNGFSGHADQNDFQVLLRSAAEDTGRVRLVHGEPEQAEALAATLGRNGFPDVEVPHRGETVSLR